MKLDFTRRFISGTLVGLAHSDSIQFISIHSLLDWLKGVHANSLAGKLDYKIESWNIEAK